MKSCLHNLILVSPIIFVGIINTTAIKEENVTFRCLTSYSINTTVTWKFNDSDVDISNVSKYVIINTVISGTIFESNFIIINVTLLDVGMYTCVSLNEAGNDTSDGFLRVNGQFYNIYVYNVINCLWNGYF